MNTTVTGFVFNIQRYSIHDGPGIRTLVFMKGCPLKCKWCSNPEGINRKIDIMSNPDRCIGCGACKKVCRYNAIKYVETIGFPINRSICKRCGKCAKICPSGSKEIYGEVKSVDEIVKIVKRESHFYKSSGGGITMGGGEILNQAEFTYEVLKRCKQENLNTAIETCGMGNWEWLEKIIDVTDTIHYDLKAIDSKKHRELTGIDNNIIIENIIKLDSKIKKYGNKKPKFVIRMPIIPDLNDSEEDIEKAINFINGNLSAYDYVELLPFHNFGEDKYRKLDLKYDMAGLPNSTIEQLMPILEIMKNKGIKAKISKW